MNKKFEKIAFVAAGAIGEVLGCAIRPVFKTTEYVIRLTYDYDHPEAPECIKRERMRNEWELLMDRWIRHNGSIEVRGKSMYGRNFYDYIEWIEYHMSCNGATDEEMDAIYTIREAFRPWYNRKRRTHISVNNLLWLHKMEDKYGVLTESTESYY